MNLEHYKNFVVVVDTGTISAASEKLLIAQPALSNQIKSLEEKYNVKLIVRGPRRVELTDAGKIFYEKAKSICYMEDALQKEIDECAVGYRGTLWLGTTPANPDPLLFQILLDFHAAYPEISFEIFERNSDQVIHLLDSGVIEVGLIRSQVYIPADICPILTIQECLMAYYHKEHPVLSDQLEQVPIPLLKNVPISISQGLKKIFTMECENMGFQPYYLNISESRAISQLWASDKTTVAIIIAQPDVIKSSPYNQGSFCCREILTEVKSIKRFFAIEKGRKRSRTADVFLKFCRQHPLIQQWHSETD